MKRRLGKSIVSVLLVSGLVAGYFAPLSSRAGLFDSDYSGDTEENFQKGVAACAATAMIVFLVGYIVGNQNVPTAEIPGTIKEMILDCVFWAFKNAIIQEITGETVHWIQTGMAGNPAFVTNIREYLTTVADQVAGSYIEQTVPFLCSPFRADIQLQLVALYKESRGDNPLSASSCTFTGAAENVERFLDGDFASGGWDMWFQTYSNPNNTPYGAYIKSANELSARIESASGEAELKFTLGQGFLSKEVQNCYETTETTPDGDVITYQECDPPQIITPGTQIKNSLEQAFEVNMDQIANADEWDEIISLWASYLIFDILRSDKGLAGHQAGDFTYEIPDVDLEFPAGGNDTTPGDTEPDGPPGPSMCFTKNGTFLVPEQGGTVVAGFQFPVPQNVSYDRIELDMEVKNNGWPEDRPRWPGMIFWLVRDGNKNMYGYSKVTAPNSNNVMLRWGVGQSHDYKARVLKSLVFPEGATYQFKYVYDAANDRLELRVINKANGNVLQTISGVPDVPGINVGNEKFRIGIGYNETEANPAERPMYGWEYSNLKVSFISGSDAPANCTSPDNWSGNGGRPSDGDDGGLLDDDDDRTGDDDDEVGLVEALHVYASTGVKQTDNTAVQKNLRAPRTSGWNSFGGSQNLSPIAFAALGDYKFFHELANVENSEGIGSREVGSPGFYFSMPIAAKLVALRDARAAGDTAAESAIARNLLQTWTFWSLVAMEGRTTSITANSGGRISTAENDSNISGLTVATAGDRYHGGSDAGDFKSNDQSKILSWALDVPRSGIQRNSGSLRTASGPWWDTIIAHAVGTDRYSDPTPAEKWGMTESDRANLRKLVRGDTSVLPWARSILAPGLHSAYQMRMRRTTEGVETVLIDNANGNKPSQAATSITNGGVMMTMRPCDGNADNANPGYRVTIENGVITATGDPPRCATATQPELGGSLVYEVMFDNGSVR